MCRTPKGPVGRYCNLPARSLGYYRQSGFLFCPPQLKDLLGSSSGGLPPRFFSSGDCERAIWLLPPDFPFRPFVRPRSSRLSNFFFARRAVSSVRSFISSGSTFTISLFMLRNRRQRRGREGREGGRVHDQQWTVKRLSQFGST